jgi:hypothetical protein
MTSLLQQITAVATIIIALVLVGLAVLMLPMAREIRALERRVRRLLDETHDDVVRIVRSSQTISEDVASVTTAIREDVGKVSATLESASERVRQAVSMTENQLSDFNALLTVVREEAEQLFVSTASTVRGVQRGAQALQHRSGTDFASDELDAAEAADDLMTQEEGHGDDSSPEPAAPALSAAPRIRPRAANRRRA